MPLGVTLAELRRELRAEIGHSLAISQGVNYQDTLDAALRRSQTELWTNYQWDHLLLHHSISSPAAARYIALPAVLQNAPIVEITDADRNYSALVYGIGPAQYAQSDSIAGELGDAPQRWQASPVVTAGVLVPGESQIELWPIPSATVNLLVTSQAILAPLVLDTDRCSLDSYAITLSAAALILSRQENEDAAPTQARAQEYVRRLRAGGGARKKQIRTLANASSMYSQAPGRPGIDYAVS